MNRAKYKFRYFYYFMIAIIMLIPASLPALEVTAHNHFISFTKFQTDATADPLIILNNAWGDVFPDGIPFNSGGIRSPVENNNEINELNAQSPRLTLPALFYPSPFKFSEGSELGYRLNKHMDIELRVYDIRANEIFRKEYPRGENGGLFGYNKVSFNESVIGKTLPVGVYFYLIITNGTVLGKGKFAIIP